MDQWLVRIKRLTLLLRQLEYNYLFGVFPCHHHDVTGFWAIIFFSKNIIIQHAPIIIEPPDEWGFGPGNLIEIQFYLKNRLPPALRGKYHKW